MGYNPFDYIGKDKRKKVGSEAMGIANDIVTENKLREIVREEIKRKLTEKIVKLSSMKDANFEPGKWVQLIGKKGMIQLDKKSVHRLAKIIRSSSKDSGMGWSFTAHEGKINEAKSVTLPNGIKVKIEFKGLTFLSKQSKPVFLDRTELLNFFKATARYLK